MDFSQQELYPPPTWSEEGMSGTSSFYRLGIEHTTGLAGNDQIAGQAAYAASEQLRTSKTGSFLTINREVVSQVGNIAHSETVEDMGPRYVRRPGGDPIGQITPIGDILIPMLVFTAGYVLIRSKRISKILHYAKRK